MLTMYDDAHFAVNHPPTHSASNAQPQIAKPRILRPAGNSESDAMRPVTKRGRGNFGLIACDSGRGERGGRVKGGEGGTRGKTLGGKGPALSVSTTAAGCLFSLFPFSMIRQYPIPLYPAFSPCFNARAFSSLLSPCCSVLVPRPVSMPRMHPRYPFEPSRL